MKIPAIPPSNKHFQFIGIVRFLQCMLFVSSTAVGQNSDREPGRGVVALPNENGNVTVAWRLLASDPGDASFHVYRRDLY